MFRHAFLVALALFLAFVLTSSVARAQWQPNGTPVSTAGGDQYICTICSDGAGGAIITWQDTRSLNFDIYAQRMDASGVPMWAANGVAICTANNDQSQPTIVSDGVGGAIVTWQDRRPGSNYDIYAQRVNVAGAVQWAANGVAVCTIGVSDQNLPVIVADGLGGAIVAWSDYRNGVVANPDVFAQRINSSGVAQWTANGVALCTAANFQTGLGIISDGANGAVVCWHDYRSNTSYDVYTQRINVVGVVQWLANGVAVSTAASSQFDPTLAPDGTGGAIVTWQDARFGSNDIYAQRINGSGTAQWTADGVVVTGAANGQQFPRPIPDGAGGAMIVWEDYRSGSSYDVYAQRIDATGTTQWVSNGVALCTDGTDQHYPTIDTDGAGGAIVTWQDRRTGYYNIYAQRVDPYGAVQWGYNGMPLTAAAPGDEWSPQITSDGVGNALVAWYDSRTSLNDVYAQRVDGRYGYWGKPDPLVTSVADIRNDQGGKVKVNWSASGRDVLNQQAITHYSIWRAVDVALAASATSQPGVVTNPARVTSNFSGKALWKQHAATTDYYWEWVGNQSALYQKGYTFSTPTRADSLLGNTATERFMVVAHTYNDFTFWPSNVVSGHSVDNLAPAAPLFLTAQRAGANVNLKWNRVHVPDLRDYSVYRATSSGVTPLPPNFLADSEDTILVDAAAPPSTLYYIVTAYDVHANQSQPSNEAAVAPTTGVGNLPPITALTVLQNHPNPFANETELSIGLPAPSDVNVKVFDVAGRMVSTVAVKRAGAGWQKVAFSGRDDQGRALASGVYFYRVSANGKTITRKMVITR